MGVRAVLFVAAGAVAAASLAGYATGAAGSAARFADDVITRADEPPPEKKWKPEPVTAKRQKPRSGFRARISVEQAKPAESAEARGQSRFERVLEKRSQTSAREATFAGRLSRARASNARASRSFRGRVASKGGVSKPRKAKRQGFRARVERQRAKERRSGSLPPFVKRSQRSG